MKYPFSISRVLIATALLIVMSQNAYAIHPSSKYASTPSQEGMEYDSLNIRTTDNYRLTGWYCKPALDSSSFLIILAGGDAGNMSYDIPLAKFLTANFNLPVLLFDYRGFGSSEHFNYDSSALAEPQYLTDLDAAITYASRHYPNRRIILYGRSLGGSLAIIESCKRTGISGVIAESPYVSQKLLQQHFQDKNRSAGTSSIQVIESNDLEPLARISEFKPANVLLLHGANEKLILSGEEKSLLQSIPARNKTFLDFPGCDHLELPIKSTQKFGEAVAAFLTSCE